MSVASGEGVARVGFARVALTLVFAPCAPQAPAEDKITWTEEQNVALLTQVFEKGEVTAAVRARPCQ